MVRALFAKWKIILYYNYDTKATKELLLRVITYAEKRGIRILAVVCDMGPANAATRRELGVTTEQTTFPNPVQSSEVVYFFHDVPHTIKLLRNHFFDDGVRLLDGTVI